MTAIPATKAQPAFPEAALCSERKSIVADLDLKRAAPTPRKLRVIGRDASVRLEQGQWEDLDLICGEIGTSINELARRVQARCNGYCGLTTGLREFVLGYWRAAATNPQEAPQTRVQTVLLRLGAPPLGQLAAMLLRVQDRIAPHLTPGRVRSLAELPAHDIVKLGANAREQWGETAPWESGEDFIAGQALRNLLFPTVNSAAA